jgi:ABC-type multidrug transport system ATPase subunit
MKPARQTGLSVVADAPTVVLPDASGSGGHKTLLESVSFRIEPGEFVCVLGPSGAGKSTLARVLLGEREITAGSLLVGGHDVFREADALRGSIGYVPQRDVNPPALPVERALHYASEVRLPAATSAAGPPSIGPSPRSASRLCATARSAASRGER